MLEGPRLASLVASKVCHDIVSPMSVLMQGVEMLRDADTTGKNAEAIGLIEQCVNKAFAKLDFFRSAIADGIGSEGDAALVEIKTTAERLYSAMKPKLDWAAPEMTLPRAALKAVLNVLFIAGDCLPKGGTVRLEASRLEGAGEIRIIASGARAILKADTAACLAGQTPPDGFQPYNIVPALTGLLARQAGVTLLAREAPERIELVLRSGRFVLA